MSDRPEFNNIRSGPKEYPKSNLRATYFVLHNAGVVDTKEFVGNNPASDAKKWFNEEVRPLLGDALLVMAVKGVNE